MPNANDDKLVTLADLAEAYNALYNRDVMIGKTSSDAAAGNAVIADSTARTISTGISSAYSVTNLTADHVVAAWRFSGGYSENNPPANITVTTANGSYTILVSNLLASGITMQPVFIKP